MTLLEFKKHIESFPGGHIFQYGISEPFSWRGSYDQVAFSIVKEKQTRDDILSKIQKAYDEVFYGWKGGEYRYGNYTNVNFESGISSWTDDRYTIDWIEKIEGEKPYKTPSERLITVAFK